MTRLSTIMILSVFAAACGGSESATSDDKASLNAALTADEGQEPQVLNVVADAGAPASSEQDPAAPVAEPEAESLVADAGAPVTTVTPVIVTETAAQNAAEQTSDEQSTDEQTTDETPAPTPQAVCTNGATRCGETNAEICVDGQWTLSAVCDFECHDGTCAGLCNQGDAYCDDRGMVLGCDADGLLRIFFRAEPNPENCLQDIDIKDLSSYPRAALYDFDGAYYEQHAQAE